MPPKAVKVSCNVKTENETMATVPRKRQRTAKDNSDKEDTIPRNAEGQSMNPKAINARKKALAEKFVVVQDRIQVPLEKAKGIVVDCFYHGPGKNAVMNKAYDHTHLMKLVSPRPFILTEQVMLEEGPYAGHVAILLKQSKPFPLMELPANVRMMIFTELLTSKDDEINMNMSQGGKHAVYSPNFRAKNKLAILAVNKTILNEAAPIVYRQKFHFPGTQPITVFLVQIKAFRRFLAYIRSDTYNPTSARNMFHLLPEAHDFRELRFEHVSSNEGPVTAIKNMFNDAHPWFISFPKEDQLKALEVIKYNTDGAFHRRTKNGSTYTVHKWGTFEWQEFHDGLRAKVYKLRQN